MPDPTPVIPDGLPRCSSNHALSLIEALRDFKAWFDAHGCPFCQIDNYQTAMTNALKDQQERHAKSVDTACGMDDDPKGMSCAPVKPGGKVYHQAGCGREDAEYIRSGNA